jgi:hypothetical protein
MNGWVLAFVIAAQTMPKQDATELRPRATVSGTVNLSVSARIRVEGIAEALVGDRRLGGRLTAFDADAREAWIEVGGARADLRAGYGRLAWGRLDEVQPSDVINPIDTSRYFIDGRSDARLPVAFARGRVFLSSALTVEGVLVPFFRRSRFDSLDEPTSPFNLVNDAALPPATVVTGLTHRTPERSWSSVQGGGRVSATVGRVDVSASVYRGFNAFGDITFEATGVPVPGGPVVGRLIETYPRFTMIAGDFETVTGAWAWRGEAAWFKDRAFDLGAGVDRKTGEFRVFGSVLMHRDVAVGTKPPQTNVNVVGSIGRERYLVRVFGLSNPRDRSGFARALLVWSATDQLGIEVSAAKFMGTGDDTISRFAGRDFLLARVRYYVQ